MTDSDGKNVVNILREKTEEADLERYLKKSLYGYSKKSVMNYIAAAKKQQADASDTFNRNLQDLYEEKKSLQENCRSLQEKLTKAETELKNLTEAIGTYKLEGDEEYSARDILALKSKLAALEGELKKADGTAHDLKVQNERLNDRIAEKDKELEKSKQETQIQKELLLSEKAESKKQRDLVLELSGKADEYRDEAQYLKGILTDGKTAELNARIDELMVSVSKQEQIIINRNVQLAESEKEVQTLSGQNEALQKSLEHLTKSLESVTVQNEKLEFCNKTLTSKLNETHNSLIESIKEQSGTAIEKLILGRKLDEANQKLSSLEMGSMQRKKAETIRAVSEDAEQAKESSGPVKE